jgi:hypothetical protein
MDMYLKHWLNDNRFAIGVLTLSSYILFKSTHPYVSLLTPFDRKFIVDITQHSRSVLKFGVNAATFG